MSMPSAVNEPGNMATTMSVKVVTRPPSGYKSQQHSNGKVKHIDVSKRYDHENNGLNNGNSECNNGYKNGYHNGLNAQNNGSFGDNNGYNNQHNGDNVPHRGHYVQHNRHNVQHNRHNVQHSQHDVQDNGHNLHNVQHNIQNSQHNGYNTNNNNRQFNGSGEDLSHKVTNGQSGQNHPTSAGKPPKPRAFSARSCRSAASNGHRRSHTDVVYQDVIELSQVSANFAADLDAQYGDKVLEKSSSDMAVNGVGLQQQDCESTKHVRQRPHSSNPRVNFQKVPTMLLPKARPRGRTDFLEYIEHLRDGTVIANDPRTQMIISSQYNPDNTKRPTSANSINSLSTVTSSAVEKHIRSLTVQQETYLDTYASIQDIASPKKRHRRRRTTRIIIGLTDGAKQEANEAEESHMCPECVKLIRKFGGQKQLMTWIEARLGVS